MTGFRVLAFLLVAFCFVCLGYAGKTTNSTNSKLPAYFLTRNDIRSRPEVLEKVPPGGGNAVVDVEVSMIPVDILNVDDVRQVVSASIILYMLWTDRALSWSLSDPSIPDILSLPANEVWTPDLWVVNGATSEQRMPKTYVSDVFAFSDGVMSLTTTPVVDVTCKMDLRAYPFDTQYCSFLLFVSSTAPINASYAEDEVFTADGGRFRFSTGAEWSLEKQTVERRFLLTYVYLEFKWTLKRKTTYFVISFLVPIVLTSYMNTLVFLMPVECGERVSYLVSIFVSTAVFVSFCTDVLPQGLDQPPLIMYLVLGTMMQSAVLLVINSLILRRFHGHPRSQHVAMPTEETALSRARPFAVYSAESPVAATDLRTSEQPAAGGSETGSGVPNASKPKVGLRSPLRSANMVSSLTADTLDGLFFFVAVGVNTVFVASILLNIV